ncbi:hypothetical protein EDD21DRAFT_386893 [Dissophora ornata]|nr:hypothetical protein EDD21DRAFT_386893 [Dissophora ornata]
MFGLVLIVLCEALTGSNSGHLLVLEPFKFLELALVLIRLFFVLVFIFFCFVLLADNGDGVVMGGDTHAGNLGCRGTSSLFNFRVHDGRGYIFCEKCLFFDVVALIPWRDEGERQREGKGAVLVLVRQARPSKTKRLGSV